VGDKHHTLAALLLGKDQIPTVLDGWDSGAGLDRHGKSPPPPPPLGLTPGSLHPYR